MPKTKDDKRTKENDHRTSYVAFLRGINVGGHNIVRMERLSDLFASLGFTDLKIYIQSGNVVFSSAERKQDLLTQTIEKALNQLLQKDAKVMVRSLDEVKEKVKMNPFKKWEDEKNTKFYVTISSQESTHNPQLPVFSPKRDVEIFLVDKKDFFSISRKQNGHFGFPNELVEKVFNVYATTRNWSTIKKIANQSEKPKRSS